MAAARWLIWEAPQGLRADGLLAALTDLRGLASASEPHQGTPTTSAHDWARGGPWVLGDVLRHISLVGWPERLQQRAERLFTRLAAAAARATCRAAEDLDLAECLPGESIADLLSVLEAWEACGPVAWSCLGAALGGELGLGGSLSGGMTARITTDLLRGATLIDLGRISARAEAGTTVAGAALAAELVDSWQIPAKFSLERAGYGQSRVGATSLGAVTRVMLGSASVPLDRSAAADDAGPDFAPITDEIILLETNLDDVTGEVLGYCLQRLMAAGALDAYATSIYMKKNRPATKLTVLSTADRVEGLENLLFRETGTLGIRRWTAARRKLPRESDWVETIWGPIAGQRVTLPDGSRSFFPEYEDCRRLAEVHTIPLQCVLDAAKSAGSSPRQPTK